MRISKTLLLRISISRSLDPIADAVIVPPLVEESGDITHTLIEVVVEASMVNTLIEVVEEASIVDTLIEVVEATSMVDTLIKIVEEVSTGGEIRMTLSEILHPPRGEESSSIEVVIGVEVEVEVGVEIRVQ